MKNAILLALALLATGVNAGPFLSPEQAFRVDLEREKTRYVLVAHVKPGYALYRDKIKVQGAGVGVTSLTLPRGQVVDDPDLGRTELLTGEVRIPLQTTAAQASAQLTVTYLGCKIEEFCYPPQRTSFKLQGR